MKIVNDRSVLTAVVGEDVPVADWLMRLLMVANVFGATPPAVFTTILPVAPRLRASDTAVTVLPTAVFCNVPACKQFISSPVSNC